MQATTAPEHKLRPWRRPVILALILAAALAGVALVTYDRIRNGRPELERPRLILERPADR